MTKRYYVVQVGGVAGVHSTHASDHVSSTTDPGTGSPFPLSVDVPGLASNYLTHSFYTPSGEPNSADWPVGLSSDPYEAQIDVAAAGADLTYGTGSLDGGHFARVGGSLTSDAETWNPGGGKTGTGLKQFILGGNPDPTAGSASDRFEVLIGCDNANMMAQNLTINIDTSNTYLEGPWEDPTDITHVTTTEAANSNSSSLTASLSSFQVGDLLLANVCHLDATEGSGDFTGPSGWTLLGRYSADIRHRGEVWYKIATSPEPNPTWSAAVAGQWVASVSVYRTTTTGESVLPVAGSFSDADSLGSSTVTSPSKTATAEDRYVVAALAWDDTGLTPLWSSVSDLAWNERANHSTSATPNATAIVLYDRAALGTSYSLAVSTSATQVAMSAASFLLRTQSGSSGTQYDQALTASLSFSGVSPAKQARKSLTASQGFTGQVAKQSRRTLAAGLGFAGSALKQTGRALTGGLSMTSTLSTIKAIERAFTAALGFTGTVSKRSGRSLVSSLSFSGGATRSTARNLVSSVGFSGAVSTIKSVSRAFTATLGFAGSISRRSSRSLTGGLSFSPLLSTASVVARTFTATLTFAGGVGKRTSRSLTGALSPAGAVIRLTSRSLAGAITPSGAVSMLKVFERAFSATLSFSTAQTRRVGKVYSASIGLVSALSRTATRTLESNPASLSFSGQVDTIRVFLRQLSATLTFDGALTRRTSRAWSAVVDFTGNLASQFQSGSQEFFQAFTAALSFSGSVTKRTSRAVTGSVGFSGAVTTLKVFVRSITASLSFSGSVSRRAGKNLLATLSPSGAVIRSTRRSFAAALSTSASLTRRLARSLGAGLSFSGALDATSIVARAFNATLSFAGQLTSASILARAFSATLSFAGNVQRATTRPLAASVSFGGQVTKNTTRALVGLLTLSGGLSRTTARSVTAALNFSGSIASAVILASTRAFNAVGRVSESIRAQAGVSILHARTSAVSRAKAGISTVFGRGSARRQ